MTIDDNTLGVIEIEPHVAVGYAEIDGTYVMCVGVRAANEFVIPLTDPTISNHRAAALGDAVAAWDVEMAEHVDSPIYVDEPSPKAIIQGMLLKIADCEFKSVWTSTYGSRR